MVKPVSTRILTPAPFRNVDQVLPEELPKKLEVFKGYVAEPTLSGAENFKRQVMRWRDAKLYKHFGYDDWNLFVVEKMGISIEWMETIIASIDIAQTPEQFEKILDELKLRTPMMKAKPSKQHGGRRRVDSPNGLTQSSQVYHGKLENRGGNNRQYLADKIAKESPEILDRIDKGEFKSMRAAAIAAGVKKRDVTITLSQNITTTAKALARHYTPDQMEILAESILLDHVGVDRLVEVLEMAILMQG